MKALILSLGLMAVAIGASAQSYSYVTLQQTDGTEQSLAVDGLKITFSDGNLVAVNGQTTATVALSKMAKMYFADSPAAIAAVTDGSATDVCIRGGQLYVNAPADTPVSVFTLDGRAVPARGLSAGVYLVRVGGRTYKVMAR